MAPDKPRGLNENRLMQAVQDGKADRASTVPDRPGGAACLMADEAGNCTLAGYDMSVRDAEDWLDALMERVSGEVRDSHTCTFLIVPRSLLPANAIPFDPDGGDGRDGTFLLDDVFPPGGDSHSDESVERIFRVVKGGREPGCRPGHPVGHLWDGDVDSPACPNCGMTRQASAARPYAKYARGQVVYYIYDRAGEAGA